MAAPSPKAHNSLLTVTSQVEVDQGVAFSGPRDAMYGVSITPVPEGTTIPSGFNTGRAERSCPSPGMRWATGTHTLEARAGVFDEVFEDVMREAFAAEVATGEIAVAYDPVGTAISPEFTGTYPTIEAITPGDFAVIAAAAHHGAPLETTAGATPPVDDNLFDRCILEANADKIVLMPEYASGPTGFLGAVLTAEAAILGKTATFSIGSPISNRGILAARTKNWETLATDLTPQLYRVFLGMRGSALTFGYSGSGVITIVGNYEGLNYTKEVEITAGDGTVNPNSAFAQNCDMTSDDVLYTLINGRIQVQGDSLTAFNFALDGNVTGSDAPGGEKGRARASTVPGEISVTAGFTIERDAVKSRAVGALVHDGTPAPILTKIVDRITGTRYFFHIPENIITGGGYGGDKTAVSAGVFATEAGTGPGELMRTIIVSRFA